MNFTKTHKNDSPATHGKSFGAMNAEVNGMLSEVDLIKAIKTKYGMKLSRREVRKHVTGTGRGSEWHHVNHNGRTVEMYFAEVPDEDTWEEYEEAIREDRANK